MRGKELNKATALAVGGSAVGGGVAGAALGGGEPHWLVIAVIGLGAPYAVAVLCTVLLMVLAGRRAMRAATKPEYDRAMAVFTKASDLLCRLSMGFRQAS
jgi:hypothetical protein